VPGGLPDITGVFLVSAPSVLLQPVINRRLQRSIPAQTRKGAKTVLRRSFASLRLCASNSSAFILGCGSFILFLRERLTGHAILAFNPPAEIDQLAPLRTEGTDRIVFPLDRLTAGWAFHELSHETAVSH
jgi:hypothetical protein